MIDEWDKFILENKEININIKLIPRREKGIKFIPNQGQMFLSSSILNLLRTNRRRTSITRTTWRLTLIKNSKLEDIKYDFRRFEHTFHNKNLLYW